jgi:hypothetical protein
MEVETRQGCFSVERARFFLMVARSTHGEGFVKASAGDSGKAEITRLDAVEGKVRISGVDMERPWVEAGQAAILPRDGAGKNGKPWILPSEGREFSPQFGGMLFRECAKRYQERGWWLDKAEERVGRVLAEFGPGQLDAHGISPSDQATLKVEIKRGHGGAEPDQALSVKALGRGDAKGRLETKPAFVSMTPHFLKIGMRVNLNGNAGDKFFSFGPQSFLPHLLPEKLKNQGNPSPFSFKGPGPWDIPYQVAFARVGQLPEGIPLYEQRLKNLEGGWDSRLVGGDPWTFHLRGIILTIGKVEIRQLDLEP